MSIQANHCGSKAGASEANRVTHEVCRSFHCIRIKHVPLFQLFVERSLRLMVTKKTLPLFVFFGFSILLSGCGGERIWVSVSPQVSYLAAGQTTQFKATLTSGTGVTWS